MSKVLIKGAELLTLQSPGDAGYDLRAARAGRISSGAWAVVGTGLYLELPSDYVGLIHPRSGLAAKQGVTVLNAPGTIDSNYRGEVGVILINHSREPFYYEAGDRIAQIIFQRVEHPDFELVSDLNYSERGVDGFGSSGVK